MVTAPGGFLSILRGALTSGGPWQPLRDDVHPSPWQLSPRGPRFVVSEFSIVSADAALRGLEAGPPTQLQTLELTVHDYVVFRFCFLLSLVCETLK